MCVGTQVAAAPVAAGHLPLLAAGPAAANTRTVFEPGGVATQLEVAGAVGAITVDQTVRFVCDGPTSPSLCVYTVRTTPK